MSTRAAAPDAARVVVLGIVALAAAMGIGRFAFTPLLPLMMRDGTVDAAIGAQWAAANYIGYLLGALSAARFSADPLRGMRVSLIGVAVSTVAMALPWPSPWIGAALRLAAGIFSAWALVCTSAWCLSELARRNAGNRAAWIYTGVGLGMVTAGLWAWLGGAQTAHALWLEMGVLAAAAALVVLRHKAPAAATGAAAHAATSRAAQPPAPARQTWPLILCYACVGFGYIVPATFLPAMAREQVSDPMVFGMTWPLFGLAGAASVAIAARWLAHWPRARVWLFTQGVMTLGTGVTLLSPALWALAVSALLVGGTFMVATMAGLQLVRELAPDNPTPVLARMTVAFAAGQIAGPLLVLALDAAGLRGHASWWWSNAAATALLALTVLWLARISRQIPRSPS